MSTLKQLLPFIPEPLRDSYLNRKYNKQLKSWEEKGCPLPVPHIVKQSAIKLYQKKYNVNILVETGTYLGDMVYAQRMFFKKIYTIELSEKLHEVSCKRLKKYKHIQLLYGDSGIVLGSIIDEINEKAIFWLDGHYSGGLTAKGETECPIIKELSIVLGSKIEHIILIDDAREFGNNNDYPSLEKLESMVREGGFPNSEISVKDDIVRIELES